MLILLSALATLCGQRAAAAALGPRDPTITPGPELVKRGQTTLGFRATAFSGTHTLWDTITWNSDGFAVQTISDVFGICTYSVGGKCAIPSCSNNFLLWMTVGGVAQSRACGGSGSTQTCSYGLSFDDISDKTPMTNFWCDQAGGAALLPIYATTPADGATTFGTSQATTTTTTPTSTSSSTSKTSTSSSDTSTSTQPTGPSTSPSSPASSAPAESSTGTTSKKSTPIGPIIGGVIGGIALVGLIIVGAIIALRRNRNTPSQPPAAQHPPPMQQQQQQYVPPPMGGPMGSPLPSEAKMPDPNAMAGAYAPTGYYAELDSGGGQHAWQQGPGANELPAGRMQ